MRIGVVCEGPTDMPAISGLLKESLEARGIVPDFVPIQPDMDKTRPTDGWNLMLNWLLKNPPRSRIANYLGGGLFGNGLSAKRCDVLVFQMDADILDPSNRSFQNWTRNKLGYHVTNPSSPIQRGNEIRMIIEKAGDFNQLPSRESKRHLAAPAVESTETWCVAAFGRVSGDPERLNGSNLCQEFMTALHLSEGRPVQPFKQIDKTPARRRKFWQKHAGGFRRVEAQCRHYRQLVAAVVRQAKAI